jgi:uncharacterized protein (DUF1501 family)
MSHINTSRRDFLKHSGALSAAGTFGSSLFLNLAAAADAAAADGTGYKALVCIFLEGGNDACNTILPEYDDTESWARYNAVRGSLRQDKPVTKTSGPYVTTAAGAKTYPLHSSLSNVGAMLNESGSKLALVANVGNILSATTNASTTNLPALLRSHNDQTTVWHDGKNNMATSGWGGRSVQLTSLTSSNAQANAFRAVVLGNNNVFCYGANSTANVRPYGMVRGQGVIPVLPQKDSLGNVFGSLSVDSVLQVMQGKYTNFLRPRTNLIELDYIDLVQRAQASQSYMASLLKNEAGVDNTPMPVGEDGQPYALAQDLRIVAKVIAGQSAAGTTAGRQVFYVSLRGFDIHTDSGAHAKLLTQLDKSLRYFRDALGSNMANVLAFTASEFGRLLHSNGDGCDHGWGGHQIVMGGPVKGGTIYGTVPHYKRGSSGYSDPQMWGDGALVPSISLGSYAASMLRWFGVTSTEMTGALDSAAMVGDSALSGMLV